MDNPIATNLQNLASEFASLTRDLEDARAHVERLEEKHRVLREVVLPEAMEQYGSTLYRLPDGTVIEIKPELYARIAPQDEEAAFAYLEASGHGGLIRREIIVAFGRDQEQDARALRERLAREFSLVRQKSDVHWKTLTSWAQKRLEEGEEIDPSITVEKKNVAKLKLAKA